MKVSNYGRPLKFNSLAKVLFILHFVSSTISTAQSQDLHFDHITTDDGLSNSSVTCIIKDAKGFMWIGTFNGLNRFDGSEFTIYQYNQNDPHSISDNYISSIIEDHNGKLWIGTNDGLNFYNRSTDSFKHFRHDINNNASIIDNQIEVIFEDSKNRLWIGTRKGGLDLYDRKNLSFIHHAHKDNDSNTISSNFVQSLFEDSKGNIWIGHRNGDIDILYNNHNNFSHFVLNNKRLTNSAVTSIVESANRNIWIGTQGDGIYRIQLSDNNATKIIHYLHNPNNQTSLTGNIILSLMIGDNNKLWIGTEDAGLNLLDISKEKFYFYKNDPVNNSSLNNNSIYKIYNDKSGNIWIGTYAGGINLLSSARAFFNYYCHFHADNNSLSSNVVNNFLEDKDKRLWIATGSAGFDLFDMKNKKFTHYNKSNSALSTNVILSLCEDNNKNLWIGTWEGGLFKFNKESKSFTHYTKDKNGLGSNNIFKILDDKNGNLWLSTFWGGLTYFNVKSQTSVVYNTENSALIDNDLRTIAMDYQGNIWIGSDLGLTCFNPETKVFNSYQHHEDKGGSLSKGFVNTIMESRDSTLWIGTEGGLNKFNRKDHSFIHYNKEQGLPSNEIMCIIEDIAGDLWISTSKGISRLDPKTGIFKNYDVLDGLQGNEFNARSGFITKDGEILFGGNNGFNMFQPESLKDNPFIPPVEITGLKIFNKPAVIGEKNSPLQKNITETKELEFSYGQSVISFNFAALNYIRPEKNQYAYLMKGFDKDWNYIGSNHTATYTNLDPGNYVFMVKASNNDGVWNNTGASIKIIIDPPFWRTWWAYTIEALLILIIAYFILNYYVSRQQLRNTLKMERLELEKMYELDLMKTRFFSNVSHEFSSPITLILNPLEKLIKSHFVDEKLKNSLSLIHRNAQRLQRMTNQLKDFNKLETGDLRLYLSKGDVFHFIKEITHSFWDYARDHHIDFHFNADHSQLMAWFDPDKLDKIIYNLLSNAFKFTTDGGKITISVSEVNSIISPESSNEENKPSQYVEIKVKDSGIGIPKDKLDKIFKREFHLENYNNLYFEGSGIGLTFVHELVQLYKGEISVESIEGAGSTFTVKIPIDESYLEENQLVSKFKIPAESHHSSFNYPAEQTTIEPEVKTNKSKSNDIPVVLIVEDDKEIRDYIKGSFEKNYRLHEADNGLTGFDKAAEIIPDIIITDIKMMEMDGIELCKKLKSDERTSHIAIIMLTGYSSLEYQLQGLANGADVYLTKPFNVEVLEAQMTNLYESRKKLREKYSREIVLGPSKLPITDIDGNFLMRITKIIEEHISDYKFNADLLSKEIGMSRMQLYRKLRALTDQTVHEFIRNIRLKRAIQLLEQKRMTITEVAYEVGFNDLTYFARCFRKQYDKSPSEYISARS